MLHSRVEKRRFLDPRYRAASIFSVFLHNGHIGREGVLTMNTGQERGGILMKQALIMNAPLYDFTIKE